MSDHLFNPDPTHSPPYRDPARPDADGGRHEPMASRMRPRSLEEMVGHEDVLGTGTGLRRMLDRGELTSLVLWGPPGAGKTSLARVVTTHVRAAFVELSAVTAGVRDIRKIVETAAARQATTDGRTILFLDEIHRFNKAQQDALLPAVESGTLTLIGATTENPYFQLNAPLLSRCRLVCLEPLSVEALTTIVARAVTDPRGLDGRIEVTDEAIRACVVAGGGDARAALNALEQAVEARPDGRGALTPEDVLSPAAMIAYDRGDAKYDQLSAFIKSMRGSDPDAAVYWLHRMLAGGEDPLVLARRMVILASEDIGLADRGALVVAVTAFDAVHRVGMPEAGYALTHAALSLAMAPKSNSVARAMTDAHAAVRHAPNAAVPAHLREPHSTLGTRSGEYDYPHDHRDGWVAQQYMPDGLVHLRLYHPTGHGHEAEIAQQWERRRGHPAHPTDHPGHEEHTP